MHCKLYFFSHFFFSSPSIMAKTKGAKKIQWNDVRADIQRMYVYEGLKLKDVRSRLRGRNFDAS